MTVFLDSDMRVMGKDHLVEYRESVFYPILTWSPNPRGDAFARITERVLNAHGYKASVINRDRGPTDMVEETTFGKVEHKGSKKASPHDSRKRTWQFSSIMERSRDECDTILLSCYHPDNTVEVYATTFDRLIPNLKWQNGGWNLVGHPSDFDTDFVVKEIVA